MVVMFTACHLQLAVRTAKSLRQIYVLPIGPTW